MTSDNTAGDSALPHITIDVDATDLHHRVLKIREIIPVGGGRLTLYFPKWLPGCHAPLGMIERLCGLKIAHAENPLTWTRDPLDVYAFHVDVPDAATSIEVEYQIATPASGNQGRVTTTADIIVLEWIAFTLYPAGRPIADIPITAKVRLPEGWPYATSLTEAHREDGWVTFETVSIEVLTDSPLFAGQHFRRVALTSGPAPAYLNIVADNASALEAKDEQLEAHRKLVREATTLFGSRHYARYEFLLALSDTLGGMGLEHQSSSENGVGPGYFTEWDKTVAGRDLLPHEFVHSWNGKFRRPADQMVPDLNTPLQNTLLWVYEGQTQYWGQVLAARSGLWSAEFARDALAVVAAIYQHKRPGRTWRPLMDTTHQPIITPRRPLSFVSWQRTEDYYSEGQLLWLEVDVLIRSLTDDRHSLDDFAKAFFGVADGRTAPMAFTFDDVVAALDAIVAHDWRTLLQERLNGLGDSAPLKGITEGGYRLAFRDEPSAYTKIIEERGNFRDFSYSLGITINNDKKLGDVVWGSPAFEAGLHSNMNLIAVNGREYKATALKDAIKDAAKTQHPIEFLMKDQDRYRTIAIPYHDGLRYPVLERTPDVPDRLSDILKPRS